MWKLILALVKAVEAFVGKVLISYAYLEKGGDALLYNNVCVGDSLSDVRQAVPFRSIGVGLIDRVCADTRHGRVSWAQHWREQSIGHSTKRGCKTHSLCLVSRLRYSRRLLR